MKNSLIFLFLIFSHAATIASEVWEDNKQYKLGSIGAQDELTYVATAWSYNNQPKENADNLDGWVVLDVSKIELGISHQLTEKEKIEQLSKSNKTPNLTDRSDDILGIDLNGNGIRDDVDVFIGTNYTEESHVKAAQQLARGLQSSLVVDINNIIKVKKANRVNSLAVNCIFLTFNDSGKNAILPSRVASELQSVTTSTKTRLLAYLAFNKALDGTTWAIPVGDTCE